MVDSKNQQINTWVTGMNLDTGDQYVPSTSYREAKNLRLTTGVDGNTGTLHNIEGVEFFQNIAASLPVVEGKAYSNVKVIHTDSVRQYGIIIVTAVLDSVKSYYIFRFVNKADAAVPNDGVPKLIFGPCANNISGNISSVTRYEDDDNIKFYYADGEQPLRVINIAPSADATRPTTDDGAFGIYPTALLSQPEFIGFGSGNLKSGAYQYGYQLANKNGAETEVSTLTNVIYTNASTLVPSSSAQIQGTLKNEPSNKSIKINIKINDPKYDRLRIVSVFYEELTNLPLIQVLRDIKITPQEDGTIEDIVFQDIDNKGISTLTLEEFNMITSVHFVPKLLETKNNYLFASNLQYQDNSFDVEYDARSYGYGLDSTDQLITILQSESTGTELKLTRDDIITRKVSVPAIHDSINPYSIIEKDFSTFVNKLQSGVDTKDLRCTLRKNPNDAADYLYGGEGVNINYKFVVADILASQFRGSESTPFEGVWTCNVTLTGKLVNSKFHQLTEKTQAVPTYGNPILAAKLKSLQRDELYRFGIVFYNKFNQASPVKWIADIRTPSASAPGFETFCSNRTTGYLANSATRYPKDNLVAVRPLGIEFEVKNMPKGAVAYEIVRCRRTESDRATITQGIIGTTYAPRFSAANNMTFASEYMTTTSGCCYDFHWDEQLYKSDGDIRADYTGSGAGGFPLDPSIDREGLKAVKPQSLAALQFTSPEICFNYETMKSQIPSTGADLQMVKFLFPGDLNTSGNSIGGGVDGKIRYVLYDTFGGLGQTLTARQPIPFYKYYRREAHDMTNYSTEILFTEQSNNAVGLKPTYTPVPEFLPAFIGWDAKSGNKSKVSDVLFPAEGAWNKYNQRMDYIGNIGGYAYNNWVCSSFKITGDSNQRVQWGWEGVNGRTVILRTYIPGTGQAGSVYSLLPVASRERQKNFSASKVINDPIITSSLSETQFYNSSIIGTMLCNLRKSVIPYGGYSYGIRQFNSYIGVGGYKVSDERTLTIFPGDTYIDMMAYSKVHYAPRVLEDGSGVGEQQSISTFYRFPVETAINLATTSGASAFAMSDKIQLEPANVEGTYIQDKPMYVYNSIYSVEPTARVFTPETLYDEYNKLVDTRTVFSLNKNNDETIDSWTKFKPLNYLDVDSKHGPITNLRTFGNELIFWQTGAVGKFSVNERSLIQDDSNSPLLLGTGEVLSRYDYFATANGMHEGHNDSDCQSDRVLYWYDYDKHELCAYSGGQIECISKAKYVQSYLNRLSLLVESQIAKPMLTFDKQYNEVISTLAKDQSLIYNETLGVFTGFYTIVPDYNLYFHKDLYFTKGDALYKYNGSVHNTGFNNEVLPIQLKYIVNDVYLRTKVFDNIEFTGVLDKETITFMFEADNIISTPLRTPNISDRENNYRGAIPRAASSELFANRMRGRVLKCTMDYNMGAPGQINILTIKNSEYVETNQLEEQVVTNNGILDTTMTSKMAANKLFELPYVRTTYRISNS